MSSRGPYAKGEAKRAEIVDVAIDLFTESGYDRTSFREIARRAGLSQAGLLHYFRTKEELFVEVLRRRDQRNEIFHGKSLSPDVTLEGLVKIVVHNSLEPGLVRLYAAMSAESTDSGSPSRRFFIDRYDKLRHDLAADIATKQAQGLIGTRVDPEDAATLFIALADGLQIQWLLEPEKVDMGGRLAQLDALVRATAD